MHYPNKNSTRGGTLLNSAIIIVTLSLITGVIVILLEVNRQSKIRTVITESERFQAAVMNFKQRYDGLPGDTSKAAAYIKSSVKLKNGDGNLRIEHSKGEGIAAWQHLIASESIRGISLRNLDHNKVIIGENVPLSKLETYGWHFDYAEDADGNHFGFGATSEKYDINIAPSLTPWQAWEIDKRLDDGNKMTGQIRAFSTEGYDCGKTDYDLEKKTVECMITIKVRAQ